MKRQKKANTQKKNSAKAKEQNKKKSNSIPSDEEQTIEIDLDKISPEAQEVLTQIVDIDDLPNVNRFTISIDGNPTELQIGDKIVYPENSGILKTVVSLTIFEDKTVNYLLKWFDSGDFKSELVSLTDLKLLKQNNIINKVGLDMGFTEQEKQIENEQ